MRYLRCYSPKGAVKLTRLNIFKLLKMHSDHFSRHPKRRFSMERVGENTLQRYDFNHCIFFLFYGEQIFYSKKSCLIIFFKKKKNKKKNVFYFVSYIHFVAK